MSSSPAGQPRPAGFRQAHLLGSAGGCGAADVDRTSDLRPAADSALSDAAIGNRRGS